MRSTIRQFSAYDCIDVLGRFEFAFRCKYYQNVSVWHPSFLEFDGVHVSHTFPENAVGEYVLDQFAQFELECTIHQIGTVGRSFTWTHVFGDFLPVDWL